MPISTARRFISASSSLPSAEVVGCRTFSTMSASAQADAASGAISAPASAKALSNRGAVAGLGLDNHLQPQTPVLLHHVRRCRDPALVRSAFLRYGHSHGGIPLGFCSGD